MAVTINAKGTSVPYFKIGKSGVTLFQGDLDPHISEGFSVKPNDVWVDTANRTFKFRTGLDTWQPLETANKVSELVDIDLTGLADGYFLRYNALSQKWEPQQTTGGLAADWGSISDTPINYDGYTGDVWQLDTQTATAKIPGYNALVGLNLTVSGNTSLNGNLTVAGNATISGNLTFGNDTSDTISFGAGINSTIFPQISATYDIGNSTNQWNNAYIAGTIDNSANTGAMIFPTGTTAQRPEVGQQGMVRFNSDTKRFEGHNGTGWINIDIPDDWGMVTEDAMTAGSGAAGNGNGNGTGP